MKHALVSTTINKPSYQSWTKQLNPDTDVVIIVGDTKTPHGELEDNVRRWWEGDFNYVYPGSKQWQTTDALPFNSIQRRNLGLIEAFAQGADIIITVDDDNHAASTHIRRLDELFNPDGVQGSVITTKTNWFNPGVLCSPTVRHRGLPRSQFSVPHVVETVTEKRVKIGVVASLWIGDPDVDAVERMCHNPEVQVVARNAIPDLRTWAPFNSQATAFRAELTPAMFMFPYIGRYDDIWASYVTRVVMDRLNMHVWYGQPVVDQKRNPHDTMKDLEDELYGMRFTNDLIDILRRVAIMLTSEPDASVLDMVTIIYAWIKNSHFARFDTCRAMKAWLTDMETICNARS